jgi:hypothetical protein
LVNPTQPKEGEMKIWVLYSIANDYDQPSNNLEAWWKEKPTFVMLVEILEINFDSDKGDSPIGRIMKGDEVRLNDVDWRLREIEEGKTK